MTFRWRFMTRSRYFSTVVATCAAINVIAILEAARAQDEAPSERAVSSSNEMQAAGDGTSPDGASAAQEHSAPELKFDAPETRVEMKPTDLGLRFTPGMAQAIADRFSEQMQRRYEMDDEQSSRAREIMAKNLMKLAQDTQYHGRAAFELFIENMIANGGRFTKEDGQKWAKHMLPVLEEMKKSTMTSASQIGQQMSLSQRLKLTGEMAAFSAAFVTFESRIKRWSEGDLPDLANPFEEPRNQMPVESSEPPRVREARDRAEQRLRWETDVEKRWTDYVEAAITFYEMDEAQTTSARSILKESLERARSVRTPEWTERMRQNRTTANLSQRLPRELWNGPWMWQLDREYEDLLAPLQEIGREMRQRIDEIILTNQRERALEQVREEIRKAGYQAPPA
jgi:hypothetical protein